MLIQYALIRTDLPSMKYGKGCAQGMHAANKMTNETVIKPMLNHQKPNQKVMEWMTQGDGFGTALTVGVPSLDILKRVIEVAEQLNFVAALVTDDTYPYYVTKEVAALIAPEIHTDEMRPINDEFMLCFRKEVTCGYVFGEKDELEVILGRFKLLPND